MSSMGTDSGAQANAASMGRPMSSNSPTQRLSAYLTMTPHDVDRMAEASRALQNCLTTVPIPPEATTTDSRLAEVASSAAKKDDSVAGGPNSTGFLDSTEALHKLMDRTGGTLILQEMLVEAARQCKHPMVEAFLPRMVASGIKEAQAKAGLVIFHDMDKSSKLKTVFEILAASSGGEIVSADTAQTKGKGEEQPQDHKENTQPNSDAPAITTTSAATPKKLPQSLHLDKDGALHLFQTILTAISCCVHMKDDDDIALKPVVTQDEDISMKDSFDQPPKEMTKTGDSEKPTSTTPNHHHGLADHLKKEIESTAIGASRRLVDFATPKTESKNLEEKNVHISFDTFGDWYNSGGCQVVPWLELLHLSKWRIPSSTVVPSSSASTGSMAPEVSRLKPPPPPPPASLKLAPRSSIKPRPHGHSALSSMLKEDEEAMRRMGHGGTSALRHRPPPSSRTVVTFDFSSSAKSGVAAINQPLCINVAEESLLVLRSLVYRSGLIYRSAADVCKTIMRMSHKRLWDGRPLVTMRRDDFKHVVRNLLTASPPPLSATKTPQNPPSSTELVNFQSILEDFFACFEGNFHQSTTTYHPLSHDEVNAKELAVGFCFLCAGNKSTKLATGFELLDDARAGYLTQQQLMRFLRSYLTMMVGMSLLKETHSRKRLPLSYDRKEEMRAAVENGAHWTLQHFLKTTREKHPNSYMKDAYSFEVFAEWYSKGGFNVAPWLELLDLNKLVSLLGEAESFAALPQVQRPSTAPSTAPSSAPSSTSQSSVRECRSSHRRQHHNRASTPQAQVLFTFPLANQRSLIVLRDDATYVRGVVEQLGALTLTAGDIWHTLTNEVKKRPGLRGSRAKTKKSTVEPEKNTPVDLKNFVEMMEVVLMSASGSSRKRAATGSSKLSSSVQEILSNFFHSYDLKQTNMVPLNELMGGLSLLCGGKKSTKLAFAFGVFDGRPKPKARKGKSTPNLKDQSLDNTDLYIFLRSFLIVLFSCCCQTLEMSDNCVDQYIGDTASMVADDVMRYQWNARKKDRIDFDDFGEWYNEGGFEIAPWLELLDLKKWVLVDNFDALDTQAQPPNSSASAEAILSPKLSPRHLKQSPTCPPPPPEDVLDASFFEDNDDIMPMDSIDEMDIMLMPSTDKDGDLLPVSKFTYSPSIDRAPSGAEHPPADDNPAQSLKFHLLSENADGGYMLSISQKRIRHLKELMSVSGLHEIAPETACNSILSYASSKPKSTPTITLTDFQEAARDILGIKDPAIETEEHRSLIEVLSYIFAGFDIRGNGSPNALEVACGFLVLCRGKKSDKLEYAFEVLDYDKKGHLSREEMHIYMRSFLTVLLGIACSPTLVTDEAEDTLTMMNGEKRCDRTTATIIKAVDAGSKWAVTQALKRRTKSDHSTFDSFAEWYTEEGHISIPWVELLSLAKWLL